MLRWNATVSSASNDSFGIVHAPTVLASVTRTNGDGFRQWSQQEAVSVFARSTADVRGTQFDLSGTYYDNPRAENTGALTAAELARDATLPDPLNVTKLSRKAVTHSQFALTVGRQVNDYDLSASVFTGSRSLDNPLQPVRAGFQGWIPTAAPARTF